MQPHTNTNQEAAVAWFAKGQTVISPGARAPLRVSGQTAFEFLRRHMACDWGELSDDDVKENELSLEQGSRLLSRYHTTKGDSIWIITEADRSTTTILLPIEY